jgi:hypothetical protein
MFNGSRFKVRIQSVNAAGVLCGIGSDGFCALFLHCKIPPIEYKVQNLCNLIEHFWRQFFNFSIKISC